MEITKAGNHLMAALLSKYRIGAKLRIYKNVCVNSLGHKYLKYHESTNYGSITIFKVVVLQRS